MLSSKHSNDPIRFPKIPPIDDNSLCPKIAHGDNCSGAIYGVPRSYAKWDRDLAMIRTEFC